MTCNNLIACYIVMALCRAISRWPPMLSVQRIMSGFISRYDSRSRGVAANCGDGGQYRFGSATHLAVQTQPCGGGVRSMASDFQSGAAFGLYYMMTINISEHWRIENGTVSVPDSASAVLCTLYSGALPYFRCVGYLLFAVRR